MKYCLFLLSIIVVTFSCNTKTANTSDCDCYTGISGFSTIDTRILLEKIVNKNLHLVRKEIIPSNIPSVDLSESDKYYFNYNTGEIVLRLNDDSSFIYNTGLSGKWKILQDDGILFYTDAKCDCD